MADHMTIQNAVDLIAIAISMNRQTVIADTLCQNLGNLMCLFLVAD